MTAPGQQPAIPASFKTLVYSPECTIIIEDTDVSADLVRGTISRITGGASSLEFTCSNKGGRYNNRFRRMDRVVVFMKRINRVQVFAGYLDLVPGLQLYPSTVTFRASCTIKRLLYMYWDPYLTKSSVLLNQHITPFGAGAPTAQIGDPDAQLPADDAANQPPPGTAPANPPATPPAGFTQEEWNAIMFPSAGPPATGTPGTPGGTTPTSNADPGQQKDTGLGNMLKQLLVEVGGWDMNDLVVQEFPTSFMGYVDEQMPYIETLTPDAEAAFKKLFQWDEGSGTGATPGGGGLGDATFSSIGPPSNGDAYNNEEIVWIVTNAGWKGEDVVIGSSIIKAESGGRPAAINTANADGSTDRGLWQINSIHDGKYPGENRFDPAVSTKIARDLYKARGNWDDWSTLVYHGTAQQHFDTFRPLVAGGGTMPPGTKINGSAPAAPKPATPPAPGAPKPGAPAAPPPAAAPLGSYGMPGGTNISYGAPGFPDWVYKLGEQFGVKASTYAGHQEDDRAEAGYHPNPQGLNRGIDWDGGPENNQKFAEYLHGIAASTPALEQIIWQNPGTGQKIGWAGRSSDTSGSYYGGGTYAGHTDHVHTRQSAALDGSASTITGGGGTSGGSTGSDKLAKNIFTYQFLPETGGFNSAMSTMLTGRFASLNDEPLIDVVKALCDAGMREFMSAPSGEFIAFYPDYFGIDNTAPILKLEDVEMKNVSISINDDALTTHVFTMGANDPNGMMSSQDLGGYMFSPGTVTVEDEWLFKRATEGSFFQSDAADAKELLRRFGVRPLHRTYPNIYQVSAPEAMLLVAVKLFMQKWAEQYQTSVSFTFMPELYPGMRVELVGHDLIVYVKSVTHNFDYENGFTTSAQVMAPMSVSRSPLNRGGSTADRAKDTVGDWADGIF